MHYQVFVVDRYHRPGHPTRRMDWVRKQLQHNRARLIGGGRSGRPPVLMLLFQEFDLGKTVDRRFPVTLDPGFRNLGYAVSELLPDGTLRVLLLGTLTARTPDIRGLMDERRMYRRARRNHRRENVLKKGRHAKHRPPRFESRGERDSVTLRHGVETVQNLYGKLARLAPLPEYQVSRGFRDVSLDLRALIYGKPDTPFGYQISPVGKETGEQTRAFVIRRDGGCVLCGSQEGLQSHHLRKRSQKGGNRAQNLVCLCADCHEDVHAGLVDLPISGGSQWRDAGLVNAVCGRLRKGAAGEDLMAIAADSVLAARQRHGLDRSKDGDTAAVAAAMTGAHSVNADGAEALEMEQFRRHRRQRIHAQRDRLYYLPGKKAPVAHNRNKRCDQGGVDSLAEFRKHRPADVGRLQVKPAIRLRRLADGEPVANPGDLWVANGKPFLADGVQGKNRNVYAKHLESIIGKRTVSASKARRLLHNSGIVARPNIHQPNKGARFPLIP